MNNPIGVMELEVRSGRQDLTVIAACDLEGPGRLRVVETHSGECHGECDYPAPPGREVT